MTTSELRGLHQAEAKAMAAMQGSIGKAGADGNLLDEWIKRSGALSAASREALPALLDRMETLEVENARLRADKCKRDKAALLDLMRDTSETHWCAGWLTGLDRSLWAIVFDGAPRKFGMFEMADWRVDSMREYAEAADTWWTWPDSESEPIAVPLAAARAALTSPAS